MGFNVKTQVELPKKVSRKDRPPRVIPRVFDEYKEQQVDRLKHSMDDYLGRYKENLNIVKDGKVKVIPSSNWRVVESGDRDDQVENPDILAVFFKVGTKKWEAFGKKDAKTNEQYTDSLNLEDTLKEMRSWIENMKEDSEDGQSFLKAAIAAKSIKAKYKYNEETGRMDKGAPKKK
jgi:hypothetical protein